MGDENDDLPLRDENADERGSTNRPSSPPPGAYDDREPSERERRHLFERAIPDILKRAVERAVESGANRLAEGPENLRHFVQEMKLPKEVLQYLYHQIDETKNGLYRVVAKEIRDVLEHTQFADEITKVLTKLSFEIRTEIRFVPNDAASKKDRGDAEEEGGETAGTRFPKPEVAAQVSVKDRSKDARRERRGREDT